MAQYQPKIDGLEDRVSSLEKQVADLTLIKNHETDLRMQAEKNLIIMEKKRNDWRLTTFISSIALGGVGLLVGALAF